ncbi:MAG TPA: hydroxymethylbilane synthase [Nitriliruptorales bacterium]|nr:hydroxymethylbilane synthase [Nitriliruptorales bacterium]
MSRLWRIASRRSTLARAQATQVAEALAAATGDRCVLLALSTTGDDHPDRAVEAFDAKGLFVDGVRQAVLDGRAELAVHSHKDLPTERCRGLLIGAVPRREDPRDALVTRDGARLATLRRGATIGTSSARRRAQLRHTRRDVAVQPLRGNLDTRLRRVADGSLDAVVVALAGLARSGPIGLDLRAVALEHGECLHAAAQGALAVECRDDDPDTIAALRMLDDPTTRTVVRAERALLRRLQGGCTAPVGAHGTITSDGQMELLGMLAAPSGTQLLRASHRAAATEPELVGRTLADRLLQQGGDRIVEELRAGAPAVPMGGP